MEGSRHVSDRWAKLEGNRCVDKKAQTYFLIGGCSVCSEVPSELQTFGTKWLARASNSNLFSLPRMQIKRLSVSPTFFFLSCEQRYYY